MSKRILLLRGINIGPAQPRRDAEAARGTDRRRNEGRARLTSRAATSCSRAESRRDELARETERAIADEFGFDVDVVVRTRDELAEVVKLNPLGDVADNPSSIR